MLEATPFQLNLRKTLLCTNSFVFSPGLTGYLPGVRVFAHDMIDSHIRGLPWFSSPRKVHLIWTEGFATVEEVLDIDFEVRAVGELLHHPCEGDIGETMGGIPSADGLMDARKPSCLK